METQLDKERAAYHEGATDAQASAVLDTLVMQNQLTELRAAADRLAEACEGLVKAADHPFATDRDEQAREALTAYHAATASESAQAAGPTS